ncbi:chitin deacetylase [Cryptotrichosporon argae]
MMAAFLLLFASSALAQLSTSAAAAAASAATSSGLSVNPTLPQTAATGPGGFVIPSLTALTSGAATDSTIALDTTYAAGAAPTAVSGAPAIPTAPSPANYPALDTMPPLNSTEVQQWISEIDWSKVTNYTATTGDCAGSPDAITDGRCWWTCGGCTRETDITACPDVNTWGVSFDDGPSPFTPLLLDYLDEQQISTTFFVVGSRVISRPAMVVSEYMAGHQISVHTWSHPYLTTLTNEQIVAELGWTKKVIKDTIGVTPNTFRPPYGDIDDRVRAIAAQMGLTPIIWTSITTGGATTNFDTTDWKIPGNQATGASALARFEDIIQTYAPQLDTGFIVLEHDLYQQTVDLAVGYTLPLALAAGKYKLESIASCLGLAAGEAYIETSSNNTATMITSPTGTGSIYQPVVGTAIADAAVTSATSGSAGSTASGSSGSAASGSTRAAAASGSASASAATSKAASGAQRNVAGAAVALAAVAGAVVLAL